MTTPLPPGWETALLEDIGAPVTQNDVANLDAWQAQEGGSTNNPDAFNPFNTTLPAPGSYPTNSAGVQAFPDWATGLEATAATIEQPNMAPIAGALQADAPLPTFEAAVNASPWGTQFPGVPASASTTGAVGNLLFPGAGIVGGALGSSVWGSVEPFLAKAVFVVAGLAVAVFGLSRLAKPQLEEAGRSAGELAPLAAA